MTEPLGYAVVMFNQASGWPELLDGSFCGHQADAEEMAERERAETRRVGRGEHYSVVELTEVEPS